MKDVALRAGVSLGTVSNVLNKPELVKPATRARVEQAIAELGFVRNESARHLRGGQSRFLAYLMLDHSNPFFTDIATGIEQVARAHNLGLFLCTSDNDREREQEYLAMLLEQRTRGVLITALDYTNELLQTLPRLGVPLVFVDRRPDSEKHWCSVGVDDVEGGDLAVSHLLDQGHERIGFVGGPQSIAQVADRLTGARRAVAAGARDADTLSVIETVALTVEEGRRAGARVLGIPARRRPTAVFCANDLLAVGVLQEVISQGVNVPDELAIVGYDDIEFASAAAIPLTSVRQPRDKLGITATELLLEEAAGGKHEHTQIQFVPELVVRSSSRRARQGRRRAG